MLAVYSAMLIVSMVSMVTKIQHNYHCEIDLHVNKFEILACNFGH